MCAILHEVLWLCFRLGLKRGGCSFHETLLDGSILVALVFKHLCVLQFLVSLYHESLLLRGHMIY